MLRRRFLVTGGSQGIGAALVGRPPGRTPRGVHRAERRAAEEGRGRDGRACRARRRGVPADNARVVEVCLEQMGGVDVLVNNAGYAYRAEIGALDLDAMRAMFDTNVFGLVDITNRVVPGMKDRKDGDIINIASTSGMKGGANGTPYAASKWAVRGISQVWQAELRPHGIRVTCVCPSEVQTASTARPAATTRTSSMRRTSPPPSWRRSTCRAASCGRNWRSSQPIPGRKIKWLRREYVRNREIARLALAPLNAPALPPIRVTGDASAPVASAGIDSGVRRRLGTTRRRLAAAREAERTREQRYWSSRIASGWRNRVRVSAHGRGTPPPNSVRCRKARRASTGWGHADRADARRAVRHGSPR